MLTQVKDWTLSADGIAGDKLISDEVEREITKLLRAKAPELSAENSFRIAAHLVESAAATIVSLQGRVAALEAEQAKKKSQELELESLSARWRDMAIGLKAQVQDLEDKLAHANKRAMQAEVRAQNAEDDSLSTRHGSLDLCDMVIATFGTGTLIDRVSTAAREAAAAEIPFRQFAGSC